MSDHEVSYLGGRHHAEGVHDTVGVLLADLADEKGSHARSSSSTQRVGELETLQAVAAFRLFADHIQDWVHQLSSLCVVTLGPVVTSTALTWRRKVDYQVSLCALST